MDVEYARARVANRANIGNKRKCCSNPQNLNYSAGLNDNLNYVTLKCKHCGAVHREFAAASGSFSNG